MDTHIQRITRVRKENNQLAAVHRRCTFDACDSWDVADDTKWGIYGVMLYKNGGWEWAIIDDWVAVQQDQKCAPTKMLSCFPHFFPKCPRALFVLC